MAQPGCRSRSASDEIRPVNAPRPLSRRASDGNTADALLLLQDTESSQQPGRHNCSTPGDPSGINSQNRRVATCVCACTRCQRVVGGVAIAVVLLGAIVFVVVNFATSRHLVDAVTSFLDWLTEQGFWGVVLFVGAFTLATIVAVPAWIFTVGAGFVFSQSYGVLGGVLVGSVAVQVGATLGAVVCFLIARFVFRGCVVACAQRYPVLEAIDTALQHQGLRVMVLLRFSPLVPYNVFNYVAGATAVSLKDYTLGCIGMIPGVIAFVYFGTLFTSATAAASSQGSIPAWAKWTLLSVGAVASVAAIYFVTAYSRRELRRLVLLQRSPGGALMVDARDRSHGSGDLRV